MDVFARLRSGLILALRPVTRRLASHDRPFLDGSSRFLVLVFLGCSLVLASVITGCGGASTTQSTTGHPVAQPGGPYIGFTGQDIAFSGAASTDATGVTLGYSWNFGDGSGANGVAPTHTFSKAGAYTVTLNVSDSAGYSASANTTATVTDLGAPVVNIGGPYTGAPNQTINFDASGSTDPNKGTLTFAWNFGDGSQGTGARVTHAYTAVGSYNVSLKVTDTYNLATSAATTITIANPAQSPTANAGGPYAGVAGTAIAFSGSGSTDPNNLALAYAWDFGDGSTGAVVAPSHAYAKAGTYVVKLTVSDSSGLSATSTTSAVVTASTTLTAAPGGPYTGTAGTALTFNGSGSSDPKGETLTYAWDFGDSTQGTGVSPQHTYAQAGTYTVGLTVTNTDKATANATATATISNALAAMLNGPYTGNVNQVLSFSASGSTAPGTDLLSYTWDFGDGSSGIGTPVTHAYTNPGTFSVKLTATDSTTAATAAASANAVITQPITLTLSSPAQGALLNTSSVNVTGTINSQNATVGVNGVAATVSSGSFTATAVPVREGVNLITATATDNQGNSGSASTSVTVDMTAPTVSVFLPTDGATVTTQQVAVTGMVTDIVTGTVNSSDVTVTVNGQNATVANRSFQLPGFLLVPGANTVTVVATDKAGNQSQKVVHVSLRSGAAQQHAVLLSGDQQSGVIDTVLPQPLVAQLVDANGAPVANRSIQFTVSASDGILKSLPLQGQTLTLVTDNNGKASVLFQLGSRAGLGINQVAVTAPGFMGQATFSATTTSGPAAFIHEFMGNNQRGLLGQPLAEAFQSIVQDAGGNPIANVPVTFTVASGDGTLTGQSTYTVNSNADGRAFATLTLGQQEGINNYTVSADFSGDTNSAVVFYASGYAQGNPASTQVSGLVLDNAGSPVPNATVSLQNTNLRTTTDANGHFVITSAPVGTVTLLVDGSTTTLAETLPQLTFVLQSLPGQDNTVNMPIYMPLIDVNNAQTVGGDQPVTLTMRNLPGVAVTIAPNSVTFPDGTHIGQMSLSQVKSDLVPMPPPNGIQPDFAWTLQPAGTKFSVPAQITIPNTKGLPPGQVQEFYQYDHDLEQFVSVGTLRVSPDGSVLNSDPGFGITKAGWSSPGCNPPPPSCTNSCDDNNVCTTDSHGPNCSCVHTNKGGGCGNNSNPGKNSCFQPGQCKDGACDVKPRTSGGCDDNNKCTTGDMCNGEGACEGTEVPDQPLDNSNNLTGGTLNVPMKQTLEMLVDGLKKLKGVSPNIGNYVTFDVEGESTGKKKCCEETGDSQNIYTVSYKLTGGITTPELPIPDASLSLPGLGFIGGYTQFGIQATGGPAYVYDGCLDKKCVSAGGSVGGMVTIGLADVAQAGSEKVYKAAASIQTGISGGIEPTGCAALEANVQIAPVVAVFELMIGEVIGGKLTFQIIPATTLLKATIPIPGG